MLLVEAAERLRKSAADYRSAKMDKATLDRAKSRAADLQKVRDRVERFARAAALLKSRSARSETIPPLAENVLNLVSILHELKAQGRDLGGSEATPAFNALEHKGNNYLNSIEQELLRLWEEQIELKIGKHDTTVLIESDKIPGFQEVSRQIREINAKVIRLRSELPGDSQDFERVERWAKELQSAWKKFDAPAAVMKFLRAASSPTGATLAMVDDEVRAWIRKHQDENAFIVRSSRAPYGR